MRSVEPKVFLISRPQIDWDAVIDYLEEVDGVEWAQLKLGSQAQNLIEFAGRMCYRSWKPGLNPNVRKVRTDQAKYLENILSSGHGSVLEHANFTFVFHNVSRVFTHELVRHRAGTAISQESMRFVRLEDIPLWLPAWAHDDVELYNYAQEVLFDLEEFQTWMADHFDLDNPETSMHERKAKTSFMRRFAPDGVATGVTWTANVRTLRHVIEARTAPGAEEEIRLVFGKVGEIMQKEAPVLFGDFEVQEDGSWVPKYHKV